MRKLFMQVIGHQLIELKTKDYLKLFGLPHTKKINHLDI